LSADSEGSESSTKSGNKRMYDYSKSDKKNPGNIHY